MNQPNKRVLKINEFIAHGSSVTCLTIGKKSSSLVATGGDDKKVNLWTLNKPTCIMTLTGHTSSISCIAFSPAENRIVSGSTYGTAKVWDLDVNKILCSMAGHKSNVTCLEYHSYADYIASGSLDSQIRLWDLRRKGCIFTYKGHTNAINSLKFSPDSKWIASAGDDGLVKIWDLKAGRLLVDLKGHQGPVTSIEFHPNEFLLASGSADRHVRFWDLEKMDSVSTSPQITSQVKQIMFDPSGSCLFASSNDYLHSLRWEPSEFYDAVFCQWRQTGDMTINSSSNPSKLIAGSFSQNAVSFYAVNLSQVAPIGTPPVNDFKSNDLYQPVLQQGGAAAPTSPASKPVSASTTRRNFRHNGQFEASEQPDNDTSSYNQSSVVDADNMTSDICNQEEYNKIFRPAKEILRPASSNSELAQVKKALLKKKSEQETEVDKSYFIDIKTNHPPPASAAQPPASPHIQQQPQSQAAAPTSPHHRYSPPRVEKSFQNMVISSSNQNISAGGAPNNGGLTNRNEDGYKKVEQEIRNKDEMSVNEISLLIDGGHDTFMKALSHRQRNMNAIRVMCMNGGSMKNALDNAVNINDSSLIADILRELCNAPNIWTLDMCIILLPAIKDLINSKYEEHMVIGSDCCKLIFKQFGKIIKQSLAAPPSIGVDLSREERQGKCRACYTYFLDIMSIIDKKSSLISSNRLISNFKEINYLMKTVE